MKAIKFNRTKTKEFALGSSKNANAVYFPTDSKKIIVNGKEYGGNDGEDVVETSQFPLIVGKDTDGVVSITKINGDSVKMNQKCNTTNFNDLTTRGITYERKSNGAVIINGTASGNSTNYYNFPFIQGRVYYIPNKTSDLNYGVSANDDRSWGAVDINVFTATTQNIITVYVNNGTTVNNVEIFPMLFDLTEIYGEGNEPTTVEEFEADYEAWFGKPLSYEPYDEGSVRSVKMTGMKSVGFNQWDEEWVNGYYGADGFHPNADIICSKNFIRVQPNTNYYIKYSNALSIHLYDNNKNYIKNLANVINQVINTENAYFITFNNYYSQHIATYNNDICINISDPSRNGTYEPYKESTAQVPITTLTGKLLGVGESVVVFPQGMNHIGTSYDEIEFTFGGVVKATKRFGVVDLGSLAWGRDTFDTEHLVFFSSIADASYSDFGFNSHSLQAKYNQIFVHRAVAKLLDKQLSTNTNQNYIYVRDDSYSSVDTFKAAMQGVMLVYELANPQDYIIDNATLLPLLLSVETDGVVSIIPDVAETTMMPILDIKQRVTPSDVAVKCMQLNKLLENLNQ